MPQAKKPEGDEKQPKKKTAAEWQVYFDQQHSKDAMKGKDFSTEKAVAKTVRELHRIDEQTYRAAGGLL